MDSRREQCLYRCTVWAAACLLVLSLQGCVKNRVEASEAFERSLSGLAGARNVYFRGETAVRTEGTGFYSHSLAYEGELLDHKLLSLVASKGKRPLSGSLAASAARMDSAGSAEAMVYEQGRWNPLSKEADPNADWMLRLNPIDQLDMLGKAGKTISEEAGAGRGTRVLRIELQPETAARAAEISLENDMDRLRIRLRDPEDQLYAKDAAVRSKLEAVWKSENDKLERLLEQSNTETVYYLTVNKQTYLPSRLSYEQRWTYHDANGIPRTDVILSNVVFSGYK